jgi:hypothetical protein
MLEMIQQYQNVAKALLRAARYYSGRAAGATSTPGKACGILPLLLAPERFLGHYYPRASLATSGCPPFFIVISCSGTSSILAAFIISVFPHNKRGAGH